ncbi:MAG TPA: hypothetical protein P5290_00610 [Candidatus Methanomethylicus sp.]|jgi:hypothetical protein|nr:hypothetical protein [Candidatus Methanomethylicus sp.]
MGAWPLKLINALIAISILAAVAVVAAMAVSLVLLAPSVSVGEPQISASPSNASISVSVPFVAANPGVFAINGPAVCVTLESSEAVLLSFSSEPITIPPGSPSRNYSFAISVNLSDLPADELRRLVTSEDTLVLKASASIEMFPLAGVGASVDASAEWSPIVANLTFLAPEVEPLNLTHARVTLPFTFINPSDLDVPAVIEGNLTSTYGASAHFSEALTIQSNSPNYGTVLADIPLPANMTPYLLSNATLGFSASASVALLGIVQIPFNATCDLAWGAPLANLTFGDPAAGPINSTHSLIAVPFSFFNANGILTAEGSFDAVLLLPNGTVAGASGQVDFLAPPHTAFESNVAFEIPNAAASPSYTLVAIFGTPYGSFQMEVVIDG